MAGLLDSLFNGQYNGQQNGLLDLLNASLMQQNNYQPSTGFNQPASPQQPQSAQASPLSIGSYQMPRLGANALYQPDPSALPANAAPTQGQAPPQLQPQQPQQDALPPALGGSNFGGNLGAGVQSFVNTPGGLLSKVLGGVSAGLTGQRTDPVGVQQQNLNAQYQATLQALVANGVPAQQARSTAMLAVLNPEAAKTVLPELLTNREKYGVVSENPVEGKKYGFINERDQTINGKPISTAGAGSDQGSAGLMAPGASYNPNLTGEAYLAQFSPEVQAATKAYINGDVMPSGNPRQQGIASQAKMIAQKYGADLGIPVSDALYSEKRKYRTELGTNSPNSAGGQAKAFNQGISHMTALADTLEKLDNSNGLGVPIIAQGVNAVRQGMSNEQSAIADEAKTLGQTVAGEVGKLFSGSAGGGVHERELTRERFDTIKSRPQLAAALRATLETMQGGLTALEQRRDSIMGPNNGIDLVSDQTRQNIAKIQATIDRLEGKSASAPTTNAPAAGGLPPGWSVKVH